MQPSDRTEGLTAGFLAGNALGAPFDGIKGGHIRQAAGGWVDNYLANPLLFPDRPEKNTLPGLHNIHGQNFIAVLTALVPEAAGRHPVSLAAAALGELSDSAALRRPGRPLARALERWAAEYPWEPQDHFAPAETSEGASACARALAGVLLPEDHSLALARLTHTREAPLAAAIAVAAAARMLLESPNPKKLDGAALAEELITTVRSAEDQMRERVLIGQWRTNEWGYPPVRFSECLTPLPSLLRAADDNLARKTLINQANEFSPTNKVASVQHGFAPVIVPWVLYLALGEIPAGRAVEEAINEGGETSLAAGLVGGLMGARYGIGHLPPHWIDGCLAWEAARSLLLSLTEAAADAWRADETRWTAQEEALRKPLRAEAEKKRAAQAPKKKKPAADKPAAHEQGSTPFAPPPHVWLQQDEDLAPWEKQRLKTERARKRIGWKEERREKQRHGSSPDEEEQ